MRAVGDTQHFLPGQSAVQAVIFVDIYTLLSHSPLCSRNGESPALPAQQEHCAPAAASAMQRGKAGWGKHGEDAPEVKQPPIKFGANPQCEGTVVALLLCPHGHCAGGQGCCLLLSTFVTPRNL